MLQAGLGSLGLLATLGAALGVGQGLASRTAERTAEIGILIALGATDAQVVQHVGLEALVMGLGGRRRWRGPRVGWRAGHVPLSRKFVFGPVPMPRAGLELFLIIPLVTTALALLAAALPAARAWRLLPADALRHT